jgi:erythromycin esterase
MRTILNFLILPIALICFCSECNSGKNKKYLDDLEGPSVKESWQKWITKNASPIISLTENNNDDLYFLQEFIGNRTLIQLGESSHGVKEYNQIKVSIIKYLHEKMGFNVIAFESGLYECYSTNISTSEKNPRNLIEAIFSVWRTQEVLELFDYIVNTQETDEPLILAGFDFQMSGDWNERTNMLKEIVSLLDQDFANELFKTDSLFAVKKKPNDITAMRKYVMENQDDLKSTYSHLKELLDEGMPALTNIYLSNPLIPLFAHQIAVSMLDYINFWLDEENEMSIRDRAMANNVDFLKTIVYPDEKIIIWAHNLHIRNNNQQLDLSTYEKIKSMGSWLHDKYPDELYTIGLYMYEGQGAYNNREIYDVKNHSPNSLESILHSTGYESCFVDLKHQKLVDGNEWMASEILTKTWGLQDLRLVPKIQYDAILFIDSVSPPDYLD